jgi:Asp/Glu/hydantoin racemase
MFIVEYRTMSSFTKIVLINANTTQAMTDKMQSRAQVMVPDGFAIAGLTAPRGAPYISTPQAAADAAQIVEVMADDVDADALIIACFGDPGLFAVRRKLPIPVIGMADASCHVAAQLGDRFAIVTGGRAWGPMLTDFVEQIGLTKRFAGVRTLELTGDMIASDPLGAENLISEQIDATRQLGVDTVILGGAGLVGFAEKLQSRTDVLLLDSLRCAVSQACAMVPFSRRLRSREN